MIKAELSVIVLLVCGKEFYNLMEFILHIDITDQQKDNCRESYIM